MPLTANEIRGGPAARQGRADRHCSREDKAMLRVDTPMVRVLGIALRDDRSTRRRRSGADRTTGVRLRGRSCGVGSVAARNRTVDARGSGAADERSAPSGADQSRPGSVAPRARPAFGDRRRTRRRGSLVAASPSRRRCSISGSWPGWETSVPTRSCSGRGLPPVDQPMRWPNVTSRRSARRAASVSR